MNPRHVLCPILSLLGSIGAWFFPVRIGIVTHKGYEAVEQGITSRQIKALWTLAHRAKLDDAALHAFVAARTGRTSVRELSQREAGVLIEELAVSVEGRTGDVPRPGAATRAQRALLARLAKGWDGGPNACRRWHEGCTVFGRFAT